MAHLVLAPACMHAERAPCMVRVLYLFPSLLFSQHCAAVEAAVLSASLQRSVTQILAPPSVNTLSWFPFSLCKAHSCPFLLLSSSSLLHSVSFCFSFLQCSQLPQDSEPFGRTPSQCFLYALIYLSILCPSHRQPAGPKRK